MSIKSLKLTPEQVKAMSDEGVDMLKQEDKEPHPLVVEAARRHVRSVIFGPTMRPTLRQRAMMFPSFPALARGLRGYS
jgi:hypothetical protein